MSQHTKTQREWTIDQLERYGSVSRNGALQINFTRLGAVIEKLRKEGWQIETDWHGRGNCVYSLITKPIKPLTPNQEISRRMEEKLAMFN